MGCSTMFKKGRGKSKSDVVCDGPTSALGVRAIGEVAQGDEGVDGEQ